MQNVFVFDIDDTLARILDDSYSKETTVKLVESDMGKDFRVRHTARAMGYDHLVYPGFYALFRWIRERGDLFHFFSTGKRERNVELIGNVMANAFGEQSGEVLKDVKVFSREDAIDTTRMRKAEGEKYQPENGYLYGQRKKKLSGVAVDPESLPWTVLIDDDDSYTTRGEEMNFFCVQGCWHYYHDRKSLDRQDFNGFHKAYYIRGAFEEILGNVARLGITLAQATSDLRSKVEAGDYRQVYAAKLPYFESGLKLLSEYDPELKFYFPLPED